MKLLFDQNISYRILKLLPDSFEGSSTVKKENLINHLDFSIWKFALANNFTIVTQDSDFNDLNAIHGFPPKIIWLRMGNLTTEDIVMVLVNHEAQLEKFINDNSYGCFEFQSI
jgi:predicted nuclease of predicted toxin-antitoxin system